MLPARGRGATASCTRRRTSRRCATSGRRSPTSRWSSSTTTRRSSTRSTSARCFVPISHVLFKTAEIQDVEPIVRRAHEVGAVVILDAYQSAGIVPLDVTALGVDFAVGGSVKWLCGGPGQRLALRPPGPRRAARARLHGLAGPRASPSASSPRCATPHGAARFLTGTPNVPALFAATPGYDLIEEIGVDRIRANSLRQTDLLIGLADAAGFEVRSPREPVPPRRHRHRARARLRGGAPGARRAADRLRLPAGRRDPARAALLQHRRRSSSTRSPRSARSSRRARTSAGSARPRASEPARSRHRHVRAFRDSVERG